MCIIFISNTHIWFFELRCVDTNVRYKMIHMMEKNNLEPWGNQTLNWVVWGGSPECPQFPNLNCAHNLMLGWIPIRVPGQILILVKSPSWWKIHQFASVIAICRLVNSNSQSENTTFWWGIPCFCLWTSTKEIKPLMMFLGLLYPPTIKP